MRVLVVEDTQRMAGLLNRGLQEEGYAVDVVANGEDAVWMASENLYDVIVLDVMLPDVDGFEVCRRIREAGQWAPVLMLTARDGVRDRVEGLDVGADDYLTKPFAFAELLARLRAVMRRGHRERPPVLTVHDLTLDPATKMVRRGDQGEDRQAVRPELAGDGSGRRVPASKRRGLLMPIRLRLTLVFALGMAVVLAGFGAFVYSRVGRDILASVDLGLRARVQSMAALVRGKRVGRNRFERRTDRSRRVVRPSPG